MHRYDVRRPSRIPPQRVNSALDRHSDKITFDLPWQLMPHVVGNAIIDLLASGSENVVSAPMTMPAANSSRTVAPKRCQETSHNIHVNDGTSNYYDYRCHDPSASAMSALSQKLYDFRTKQYARMYNPFAEEVVVFDANAA